MNCQELTTAISNIKAQISKLDITIGNRQPAEAIKIKDEILILIKSIHKEICGPIIEKIKLEDQYKEQLKALQETGIISMLPESKKLGIIGIDGKEYPIPTYEDILFRMTPEKRKLLEKKQKQGFTRLLLVPIAMPLKVLIDRYGRELIKHSRQGTLLSTDGTPLDLDHKNPIHVHDILEGVDVDGTLVYYPKQFNQVHQGITKQELIDTSGGWEIHFLEESVDIPEGWTGQTKGGRKRFEADHYLNEDFKLLQDKPMYQGETGLTPEAWLTMTISHLCLTDQQIDDFRGTGNVCYLTGAYLVSGSRVPEGCWDRHALGQASLYGVYSNNRSSRCGIRSSVKL